MGGILVIHPSEVTYKFPFKPKTVFRWNILALKAAVKRCSEIPLGGALTSIDPSWPSKRMYLRPRVQHCLSYFHGVFTCPASSLCR